MKKMMINIFFLELEITTIFFKIIEELNYPWINNLRIINSIFFFVYRNEKKIFILRNNSEHRERMIRMVRKNELHPTGKYFKIILFTNVRNNYG